MCELFMMRVIVELLDWVSCFDILLNRVSYFDTLLDRVSHFDILLDWVSRSDTTYLGMSPMRGPLLKLL